MRGPTAFFLFSEEQREQTRAECVATAEPGAKISVAVVAKAIGEKWRALSDEEKAAYQEKVTQRTKELAEAAAANAEIAAGQCLHSDACNYCVHPINRHSPSGPSSRGMQKDTAKAPGAVPTAKGLHNVCFGFA